jgi:hypothetical protein
MGTIQAFLVINRRPMSDARWNDPREYGDRHRDDERPRVCDRLREELTLAQIDHHAEALDELDVQGILAFAERIRPRASDLWVQAAFDYKQRLQQLFFPEGIAFDGNRFNRTAVTAPLFNYLAPDRSADERVVSRVGIEPLLNVRCEQRPPIRHGNDSRIGSDRKKKAFAVPVDGVRTVDAKRELCREQRLRRG